ncbi:MAG: SEC-C metal-binding domain-containing protein [Actinomycetota bacterium]|nr:SEC-C metal-binding domain-containing protein [Actinomycetota bacterium]
MPSEHDLVRAAVELAGTGVVPREAIVDHLAGLADGLGEEAVAELLDRSSFAELPHGYVHVPSLADGTTWTVRVDAEDAAEGFLLLDEDLAPLIAWFAELDTIPLLDEAGNPAGHAVVPDDTVEVLEGPDGWLDPVAGGLAAVSVVGDALRIEPCTQPPTPTEAQVAAVRAGFAATARDETVEMFEGERVALRHTLSEEPLLAALAADRTVFGDAAIPLLDDLYDAAGLERRDQHVAEQGFDWGALDSARTRSGYRYRHGLDGEQADRLTVLFGACQAFAEQGPEALGTDEEERGRAAILLGAVLESAPVATAFAEELRTSSLEPADVEAFADQLDSSFGGNLPAGVAWLRARTLDEAGRPAEAIDVLRAALGSDDDRHHVPALVDLAGLLADRGDAAGALRLLQRAGVDDADNYDRDGYLLDPALEEAVALLEEVEPYAAVRPKAAVGRNDRCPCGSGRKYKVCHLGKEVLPLEDRAWWLFRKATRYLARREPLLAELLVELVVDPYEQPAFHREVMALGFFQDVALHEGGVLTRFLADRSDLLPDDEALLAQQWALTDRGVFETVGAEGELLDVRNVGTGERITVANITEVAEAGPGGLTFGRPLPVGDSHRAFGGLVPLPPALMPDALDVLDEGDPAGVAGIVHRIVAPPRLTNTAGEELVIHTLRWSLPADVSEDALDEALRGAGLDPAPDGGPESTWHLIGDGALGTERTEASVWLDGDALAGEVNSDERAERLVELVARAVPAATLVEDEARPIDEIMASADPGPRNDLMDDPAVRDAVREHVARMEEAWLDEQVPALGGRTPREAVGDPVGREEVSRLLASFPRLPAGDDAVGMDPDRLRSLLGLPPV